MLLATPMSFHAEPQAASAQNRDIEDGAPLPIRICAVVDLTGWCEAQREAGPMECWLGFLEYHDILKKYSRSFSPISLVELDLS
jgi:hypothetical protein